MAENDPTVVGDYTQPGVNKATNDVLRTYEKVDTGGLVVDDDDTFEEIVKKATEPVVVRAGLFAVANLIAVIVGKQVLDQAAIEAIMAVYGVVGPIILGLWIRRHVTPK
ncbi:hypothetical protein [Mycobacteroides abscessus]|uniref:hypothetical protein n=1 Tax=Mycobacteroides abscessus TaxID=36809 RepID=UPI001E416F1A